MQHMAQRFIRQEIYLTSGIIQRTILLCYNNIVQNKFKNPEIFSGFFVYNNVNFWVNIRNLKPLHFLLKKAFIFN